MKKFIIKTSFFVLPFIFFYFMNEKFSQQGEGDLARLGDLYFNPSPYSQVVSQFDKLPQKYKKVSELNLNQTHKVDVLTIGDSFSEGNQYKGYLVHKGLSLLHVDRFLSEENPMQNLVAFANSDFFDYIKPQYVVLQNVERYVIKRNAELDFSAEKDIESVKNRISENLIKEERKKTSKRKVSFFSDATIRKPLNNLQFLFFVKPLDSDIYRYRSNNNQLFTNNPKELLFYKEDIDFLSDKNDIEKIQNLNASFNEISRLLAKKGIKLIILIAPDKYDLYYPYIKNKDKKQPVFFNFFDKLDKEFLYVPSYVILSDEIKKNKKDIYFYDDTHWSPNGALSISEEIYRIIKNNTTNQQKSNGGF
ncbi:MAG: hypothetical protein Q4B43_03555 [Bacteroidota bacterium]|nr:hypothetical protein [Bacteroidota bacterium]